MTDTTFRVVTVEDGKKFWLTPGEAEPWGIIRERDATQEEASLMAEYLSQKERGLAHIDGNLCVRLGQLLYQTW
jgi:hypothetical protein